MVTFYSRISMDFSAGSNLILENNAWAPKMLSDA